MVEILGRIGWQVRCPTAKVSQLFAARWLLALLKGLRTL
jgi:hypothetical protein